MGKERKSAYYDWMFTNAVGYNRPAEESRYYPMWLSLAAIAGHLRPEFVIDLGCGPGQLAEVLRDQLDVPFVYLGLDFSAVAIERAGQHIDAPNFVFAVQDLIHADFTPEAARGKKCLYIASEFLEHIEADLAVIGRIPAGQHVALTVPSFDDEGHVRRFDTLEQAAERYAGLLDLVMATTMPDRCHFLIFGIRKPS